MRHLLTANPESVYLGDLQAWLTESTGDESWANGIVGGVAGEVALARAVEDLPDVKWVEFSSPEEDREGMDIIVGFQDGRGSEEMLGIDVKSRHHLAQGNQLFPKPATRHHGRLYHLLEVGVDRNHIKDNAILDERFHQPQLSGIAARIEKLKQRHQGHRQPAYA